ncbi:aminotransferase class V-fold PLP-dependent enzyme [Virgibacillus dakarensis]|nr:aminotransferase class V-fold PLP-dependent enzyme [Virgibacillus dakarensis]
MQNNKFGQIPMVDLKEEAKLLRNPLLTELTEVLNSGGYILGEKGKKLEEVASSYLGTSYSLGVGNGTDALILALKALDIGPGDEVITTPFTFFATAEAIAQTGAKPVFVDIEETTYNIDPEKLEEKITHHTKAIMVVHLFGQAANMQEIKRIASDNNLYVIEDACQAFGTEYQGKKAGAIGDIGCFSFFPSKNFGAFGDGGLVTTNQKVWYEKINILRNHGSEQKYHHAAIGMNSRLDEFQAAILLTKFIYLDSYLHKRIEIARRYTHSFNNLFKTPTIPESRRHTFHQYCIELDKRDELAKELNNNGIASAIYYPIPLHLQKAFHYLDYQKGDFPIAEKAAQRILALPIFPTLSVEKQDYIISVVKKFAENNG